MGDDSQGWQMFGNQPIANGVQFQHEQSAKKNDGRNADFKITLMTTMESLK
jgi:hypothetical protein